MGEGRILQFDRNWVARGTWYTTGTRYFIVGCLSDGRLLCTVADGRSVFDESGKVLKHIPLPGYGWAQVTVDADPQMDTGFTAPFRSLAGLAVFRG